MTAKGGKNRKVAQETQLSVTDVSQSVTDVSQSVTVIYYRTDPRQNWICFIW